VRAGRIELIGPDGGREVIGDTEPGPDIAMRITDPALVSAVKLSDR